MKKKKQLPFTRQLFFFFKTIALQSNRPLKGGLFVATKDCLFLEPISRNR
jgi:hypothetical protein